MSVFTVIKRRLPHDEVQPGARGHKKVVIPKGTDVWVIDYNGLLFWACYLSKAQAETVAGNLTASVEGRARRNIPLKTMIEWNFKQEFPTRVVRED